MRLRTCLVAVAIVAALSLVESAADQSSSDLPAVFMGSVDSIPLPDGDGSWVLQIVSRGGLTGRGAGDVIVISDGRVRWPPANGITSIGPEAMSSLAQKIRRIRPERWSVGSRLGRCNDCIATLVALTVRDSDGVLHTYTAFWDATTRARIPDDVLHIHDLALNLHQ